MMEMSMSAQHIRSSTIGPFLKLAREEIQSIMHFLPRVELLHFCRCSRTLFADSDTDAAWRTQPLFEVDVADFLANHHFRSSSLFMRRQSGFSLRGRTNFTDDVNSQSILTALDTLPRVKRFTISGGSYIPPDGWKRLLEHSGLNQLQELYLRCGCFELASTLLSYIERLTNLTALTLPSKIGYDYVGASLRAFPLLTFIGISTDAQRPNSEDSISTALIDCGLKLTSLHICSPALRMERFYQVFSSPNLSKLKQLSLSKWQWFDGHTDDTGELQVVDEARTLDRLRTIWRTITHLQGLILSEIPRVSSIIPTLTSAPTLKELVFGLPSWIHPSLLPDTDRLSDLLDHSRDLCLIIFTNGERIQIYDYLHPSYPTRVHRILHPDFETYGEWTSTPSLILSTPLILPTSVDESCRSPRAPEQSLKRTGSTHNNRKKRRK